MSLCKCSSTNPSAHQRDRAAHSPLSRLLPPQLPIQASQAASNCPCGSLFLSHQNCLSKVLLLLILMVLLAQIPRQRRCLLWLSLQAAGAPPLLVLGLREWLLVHSGVLLRSQPPQRNSFRQNQGGSAEQVAVSRTQATESVISASRFGLRVGGCVWIDLEDCVGCLMFDPGFWVTSNMIAQMTCCF